MIFFLFPHFIVQAGYPAPTGGRSPRGDDEKATWLAGAVADEAKGARAEENNKVGGQG